MATGENLFSHQDARNLLRYGGMRSDRDILQFDCACPMGYANTGRDFSFGAGVVPIRVTTKIATDLSVLTGEGVRLGDNRVVVVTIR